jgi:hypothetical protein
VVLKLEDLFDSSAEALERSGGQSSWLEASLY